MSSQQIVNDIFNVVKITRLSMGNEKALQHELGILFHQMYGFDVSPEKILDEHNRIDFLIRGVGIEVKLKGNKKGIFKQCVRYCGFDEISSLILVTNMSMGMPEQINNKDCYLLNLGKAWL